MCTLRPLWQVIASGMLRKRAVGFVDALDSPLFTEMERETYKSRLRELGDSFLLSLAIFLAEARFNRLLRPIRRIKLKLKDYVKGYLRVMKPRAG